MEIAQRQYNDIIELRIKGRLDSYWSDYFGDEVKKILRRGVNHIQVNMSEIDYMSSAGIRVLLQFYKQLNSIKGTFGVTNPSESVKTIIELAGIGGLLLSSKSIAKSIEEREERTSREVQCGKHDYQVFDLFPSVGMKCRMVGNPSLLQYAGYTSQDSSVIQCTKNIYGFGIGAFGRDFDDCKAQFGEFLAAAGAVAYFPSDDTNVPDYMVSTGTLIPSIITLYTCICEGEFSRMLRFETNDDNEPLSLTDMLSDCLSVAETRNACIVSLSEVSSLHGVSLRRSPVNDHTIKSVFAHPEIRSWMSYSAERTFTQSMVLTVGIVTNDLTEESKHFLRPLDKHTLFGHLHAAAFSFRPLQKGFIDLQTAIANIFEQETLQGVVHLLQDDRENNFGGAQNEFKRGACWIGILPDERR